MLQFDGCNTNECERQSPIFVNAILCSSTIFSWQVKQKYVCTKVFVITMLYYIQALVKHSRYMSGIITFVHKCRGSGSNI